MKGKKIRSRVLQVCIFRGTGEKDTYWMGREALEERGRSRDGKCKKAEGIGITTRKGRKRYLRNYDGATGKERMIIRLLENEGKFTKIRERKTPRLTCI